MMILEKSPEESVCEENCLFRISEKEIHVIFNIPFWKLLLNVIHKTNM